MLEKNNATDQKVLVIQSFALDEQNLLICCNVHSNLHFVQFMSKGNLQSLMDEDEEHKITLADMLDMAKQAAAGTLLTQFENSTIRNGIS